MRDKIMRFMYGRYGSDQLSQFLMWVAVIIMVLSMLVPGNSILTSVIIWGILIFIYSRMFSKNIYRCSRQNQRFLEIKSKLLSKIKVYKDIRTHHIYTCKSCRQKIRIPRGKGRLMIRCPKCGYEFVKRS